MQTPTTSAPSACWRRSQGSSALLATIARSRSRLEVETMTMSVRSTAPIAVCGVTLSP